MEHLDPELLSAYIDHELSAAEVAAVEQHLAVCDTCRAEYEELRALSTLVRELPIYEPKRVIDVSAHTRGGPDTLSRIIAFSKPLAIAALVLLVAFAGLRLLTDDDPDDSGDQISFSAVQPTETGTDLARQASEEQARETPAAAERSDDTIQEAPADSEAMGEAPPPMAAMPSGALSTPIAAEPAPTAVPAPEGGADAGNSWLPVAIVAAGVVALAGVAGWYRFVRPRRRGT